MPTSLKSVKSEQHFPLENHNSFAVKAQCPEIFYPSSLADLEALATFLSENSKPFYILGEGSNTLFAQETTPIMIKPSFHGITVDEQEENYLVQLGASENWHNVVLYCQQKGMQGLENLALIPGSVGAAPIQNIGAYGVEFADFCLHVTWFDFSSKHINTLEAASCEFGYRDSIFKRQLHNKGIITQVTLKLPKKWLAKITYQGLNQLPSTVTAQEVMDTVIALRTAKLPDPKVIPNAGSFFKNPIIDESKLAALQTQYPQIPFYAGQNLTQQTVDNSQSEQYFKVAAAWLIEQSGMKGYTLNGVGVHLYQALVLVNYSSKNGHHIVELAKLVQEKVFAKFAIQLQPEVRIVSALGEVDFQSYIDSYIESNIDGYTDDYSESLTNTGD